MLLLSLLLLSLLLPLLLFLSLLPLLLFLMSQIVRVDDKYGEYGLVGVLYHHVAEEESTRLLRLHFR